MVFCTCLFERSRAFVGDDVVIISCLILQDCSRQVNHCMQVPPLTKRVSPVSIFQLLLLFSLHHCSRSSWRIVPWLLRVALGCEDGHSQDTPAASLDSSFSALVDIMRHFPSPMFVGALRSVCLQAVASAANSTGSLLYKVRFYVAI